MFEENLERVRSAFDAWNRDDIEAQLALIHPEFEYVTSGVFPGLAPIYRGHAGYRDFWRDFKETWESLRIEIDELHEVGEQCVVALFTFQARSRDGLTVRRQFGNVIYGRDGLAVRVEAFGSWAEALEAVGLRKQPMSQENLEVVRRLFTAFSGGDATAMLRDLDPDVVLHVEEGAQGVYRGHEGATRSYVDWTEDFDDFKVVAEEFLDKGDYVVVRTRQTGTGKSSGAPTEALVWFVCRVRAGKVVRIHVLPTEQAALEAVGLSD